ncbi:MAG: MCE family protein [Planctomycetes bacterium]|nr:MCE family protein [Planctomycetota bacterium]
MHDNGRRFRLGLFVLGAGGLFIALLGFILRGSLDSERVSYFIIFQENVKGMVVGSKVNFQGVPIGAVKDIRFQDGKTLVEVLVDPTRANIQDLTRARLDRLLVTGQVTVELEGYGPTGKTLPAGSFLQPKEDPLHSLTGTIPEVMDQAVTTLRQLEKTLARAERLLGDDNQERLTGILTNLQATTSAFHEKTLPAVTTLLDEARATNASYAALAPALQRHLDDLTPELLATLREMQALAGGLRGPAQTTLGSLRVALDDLRGFVRQLRLAPDSLLFGVSRPAAPQGDR